MKPDSSKFGRVGLGTLCDKCSLDSPCLVRRVVCCSAQQLWEVLYCTRCRVRGLVNVSVQTRQLAIFHWNDNSPIAKLSLQLPPRDVDY